MEDISTHRSDIYGFLSVIYGKELNSEQITEMLSSGIFDLLISAGLKLDMNFIKNSPVVKVEEELACEYTSLFLGPGTHVYPFESAYVSDTDGKKGYWGESAVAMKNLIKKHGLQCTDKFDSIPDHISLEFEFMRNIIELKKKSTASDDMETVEKCSELEKTFFSEHINKWVPTFCEKLTNAAKNDFYREMAVITKSFIMFEEKILTPNP